MPSHTNLGHLLARVNYPIYCCKKLSERHILVAGGGGESRTGITNTVEIYELIYDRKCDSCRARLVTRFDTGSRASMNLCVIDKSPHNYQLLAGTGMDGMCNVYDIKLSFTTRRASVSLSSASLRRERTESESSLRRRRTSSTSSVKENDVNMSNKDPESAHNPLTRKDSKPLSEADFHHDKDLPDFTFNITPIKIFQTDFSDKDNPFQKVVRYSPITQLVATGGIDGHLRVWSYPQLIQRYDIAAHTNDIDDLDFTPLGNEIVSVSRDGTAFVWDAINGKKKTQLKYEIPKSGTAEASGSGSHIFRCCRYGTIEGELSKYKLFTILNPKQRNIAKNVYLCKWDPKSYTIEKMVITGEDPFCACAMSDDGRFLGFGSFMGTIDVYISFSLKRLYHMPLAHNIFVTGVEFLKTCHETQQLIGGHDAALVSVSCDNRIMVHKIPELSTLGFMGSATFFIIFMFIIYTIMSVLGL